MQPDGNSRKFYNPPQLRCVTWNQATLLLVGHAYAGHAGARELLELLFPEPAVPRRSGTTLPTAAEFPIDSLHRSV